MYKAYQNHSPIIMSDIFPRKSVHYNLRGKQDFFPVIPTVYDMVLIRYLN